MKPVLLESFEKTIRSQVPGFSVKFKDQSWSMRLLGYLVSPFNRRFMSGYTTTIGQTVYFPTQTHYEGDVESSLRTLSHEFVHLFDDNHNKWSYKWSYLAPQVYAIILLLTYTLCGSATPPFVFLLGYLLVTLSARRSLKLFWSLFAGVVLGSIFLAYIMSGWWVLVMLAGIVCLGPWPSKGRAKWELRGYGMNMAMYVWQTGRTPSPSMLTHTSKQFTGPNYWYMCQDTKVVIDGLKTMSYRAKSGELQHTSPYSLVYGFLRDHGKLRKH